MTSSPTLLSSGLRRRPIRAAVLLVLLAAGATLSACGIPLGAAQALPASQVPADLEQIPNSTSTTVPSSSNVERIPVYFLNKDGTHLVETTADEQVGATPQAAAAEALGLLTYGPTAADSKKLGLQTALQTTPQPTPRVSVDVKTGIATVALDDSIEELFGTPQYQADAQIVYTLTDPGFGVHAVALTFDGQPAVFYFPPESFPYGPVGRSSYAAIAPLPVTTTTLPSTTHRPTTTPTTSP